MEAGQGQQRGHRQRRAEPRAGRQPALRPVGGQEVRHEADGRRQQQDLVLDEAGRGEGHAEPEGGRGRGRQGLGKRRRRRSRATTGSAPARRSRSG